MSILYSHHAGELRKLLAYKELYLTQPAPIIAADHPALWGDAVDRVGRDKPVTYLEFGVAGGRSLSFMSKALSHPDALFVGYDSFEGLPEGWLHHEPGAFGSEGNAPNISDSRVRFVKGWFQNTLHESLEWLKPRLGGCLLVHYDCDIYSATLFVLTSLWPHCPGYYFIMDDFMVDDIVALHDFGRSYPVDIEFFARLEGGLPHSVVGRVSRKPFAL